MKRGLVTGGLICVLAAAVVYWFSVEVHPFGLEARMIEWRLSRIFGSASTRFNTVLTTEFWIVVAFTLTLERLIPAKANQPVFSVSFLQDAVWFVYETVLHALIFVTYAQLLISVYQQHLQFLTVQAVTGWPDWIQFGIAILLLDLMYWTQHYVNHKVPVLWRLHSVHHSQKELNFFTDYRYHVLEYIVRQTFVVIPFLILAVEAPKIVWFAVFQRWYTRVYHGNIRTNLGPLRYILVTPQSHRVHHSIERRHRDSNYGSLFSIWDYLFGTQYRRYDEYPDTGIDDTTFPHERSSGIRDLLVMPLAQMAHPFRRELRSGRSGRPVKERDGA